MPTIYVLKCERNKYYIGKTSRPLQIRAKEHFTNQGSEWTRLYKPIEVIEKIDDADDFDEDKYTKIYMNKYGIDNVRGGSYTQLILQDHVIENLQKELCSANNACFRCNREGHFANNCYAKTMANGTPIEDDYSGDYETTEDDEEDNDTNKYQTREIYDSSDEGSDSSEYETTDNYSSSDEDI
jgi:hypothetical protein